MKRLIGLGWLWLWLWMAVAVTPGAEAQESDLVFTTVERPPFAMRTDTGALTGFSIDLLRAVAAHLGREVQFEVVGTFSQMFDAVESGRVDGAVANISITAEREQVMDFSQPIFDSGLQIMVPVGSGSLGGLGEVLTHWQLAAWVLVAIAILVGGGMLMWLFERRRQPYFDRPAREAMFPAFWWALNLVVNGGFEERLPQSRAGRVFAVILVISSLFIVSIFVAQVTAVTTVAAIAGSVSSLGDLDGKQVATTEGSTSSAFLDSRGIAHIRMANLDQVLAAFEADEVDAVVFDAPVLAYYLRTGGARYGRLVGRVFRPEAYGIALPQGSGLTEDINRALLALREDGTYDTIRQSWFGAGG